MGSLIPGEVCVRGAVGAIVRRRVLSWPFGFLAIFLYFLHKELRYQYFGFQGGRPRD